jgi:hypothetical protein
LEGNNYLEAFVGVDVVHVFLHIFVVVVDGSFEVPFEMVSCEVEEENRLAVV